MNKALFENFGVIIVVILFLVVVLLGIIIFKVECNIKNKKYNKAKKVCWTKGRDLESIFVNDAFAAISITHVHQLFRSRCPIPN